MVCLAVPRFSTLFHKRRDFGRGGGFEHKTRVLIFSAHFVRNIPHPKRIKQDVVIKGLEFSCKASLNFVE